MANMMAFKFIFLILTLLGVTYLTQAASTTNGKLLKFYPITKQQYKAILSLAKQPAIEEDTMEESHRSLAGWSSSLHDSWYNMWNATNNGDNPDGVKKYPLCVIQTPESNNYRGKRQAVDYTQTYAGIAPNIVYPGAYPAAYPPPLPYPYPYPYPALVPDNGHGGEPQTPTGTDPSAPIINCIVVVRSKRPPPPPPGSMPGPHNPDMFGHHPFPVPPYGYQPFAPYPPNSFPAYHLQPATPVITARNNAAAGAAAQYQQMLNTYYKHLHALHRADATTTNMARNRNGGYYPYQYEINKEDNYEDDDQQNDDYDNDDSIEEEN